MKKLLVSLVVALTLAACCGKTGNTTVQADEQTSTQNETKMIRLNVFVKTTEANLAEVVAGLNAVAAASQKEEGCIGYDIYQNTAVPTSLIIVETWANDAALEAHKLTEHYTTILPPLADKMTTKLERFEF